MNVQPLDKDATLTTPAHITRTQHLVHIRELDGLRGLAALMVLFHHVCFTSYPRTGNTPMVTFFAKVFEQGRTGVDLFLSYRGFSLRAC